MTKQDYEARKAERKAQREKIEAMQRHTSERDEAEKQILFDMLDRFVTAVERVADALERKEGSPNDVLDSPPDFVG